LIHYRKAELAPQRVVPVHGKVPPEYGDLQAPDQPSSKETSGFV
jgi:hypothetical protein